MELLRRDFEIFRKIIYDLCGICITEQKKELLKNRLNKRIMALKLESFSDYRKLINETKNNSEIEFLINAISTNKTEFYREIKHFNIFTDILSSKYKNNNNELFVWSAACSSGEEPYSIVMTILENLPDASHRKIKILATDIDTDVLNKAQAGVYSREQISVVPYIQQKKYFTSNNGSVIIKNIIKDFISFRQLNLIKEFPFNKKFDFIFCRNVMIYFDLETQKKLVDKIYELTNPSGYLFVGHTESLSKLDIKFDYVCPSVYQKN
ncbi:protein-glutamate O-methyltransferase CheR [Candidatus Dependentiae bacterium]|nr:protein-glutamate O-methyltransferase CheR [Candidatus Dependentiae bacterium]